MKVTIITGVCGTTGSQILDYLLEEDEEVLRGERIIYGVDNYFRGTLSNISSHLGSPSFLFDPIRFQDLFKMKASDVIPDCHDEPIEVDEIYHMAAVVPTKYFYESPDMTYKENCVGTIDLFNWAIKNHVRRFIVGSSSEIYGHIKDEDLPATETTPSRFDAEEVSTRWSYAEGKILTEHVLNHSKDEVERVCHLRFANTYGVRDLDNNHVIPYLINCVANHETIHINSDSSHFKRTFLNNKDSARACVLLMKKGQNGQAYNVGSTEEVSIEELLQTVIQSFKGFGAFTQYYYATLEVVSDINRPGDPKRRILSCERLYRDTGFTPKVSLKEGIDEMVYKVLKDKGVVR